MGTSYQNIIGMASQEPKEDSRRYKGARRAPKVARGAFWCA